MTETQGFCPKIGEVCAWKFACEKAHLNSKGAFSSRPGVANRAAKFEAVSLINCLGEACIADEALETLPYRDVREEVERLLPWAKTRIRELSLAEAKN